MGEKFGGTEPKRLFISKRRLDWNEMNGQRWFNVGLHYQETCALNPRVAPVDMREHGQAPPSGPSDTAQVGLQIH